MIALETRGARPIAVPTPRLSRTGAEGAEDVVRAAISEHAHLLESMANVHAVINTAGVAEATSSDEGTLYAANAAAPGLIAGLCARAGVTRFVHVSSATVQGDAAVLDDGPARDGFSPYSHSKALGEDLVRRFGPETAVIYRPPGVHAASRAVTRSLARLASSPLCAVAAPGTDPTPQSLLPNVADAIAFLALCEEAPPAIVAHPWEGLTTGGLMQLLGCRRARRLPRRLAAWIVACTKTGGRSFPWVAAQGRRLELLWFGQAQAESWLTRRGWHPPVGSEGWQQISLQLQQRDDQRP